MESKKTPDNRAPYKTAELPNKTILAESWRKIQQRYPEANFLQSPNWGKVNELIGHKVIIENIDHAWCLMIVKSAKRGRYLEVPGGPLVDWQNAAAVKAIFDRIKSVARAERCVFIRLRPQLRMSEKNLQLLAEQGCQKAPMHLHAEHTVMIDLSKSEDELLADMRRQTRYEVRKADKLGLKVEWGTSEALFQEFHQIQLATAARQHFVPPDDKMLLAEREGFLGDEETEVRYKSSTVSGSADDPDNPDNPEIRIYTVRTPDGRPICYGLIIIDGAEAEYFEAASTELGREFPGAYALLWRVMRDLKQLGVQRFNLWGIAPEGQPHHRYAGVTTFKKGFGGEVVEFVPAQDIVVKRLRYLLNLAVETLRKKKRHL